MSDSQNNDNFSSSKGPAIGDALDSVAALLGGAAGIASDMREQIKGDMRSRFQGFAEEADLARLEDVKRLETMIKTLSDRIDALEKGRE